MENKIAFKALATKKPESGVETAKGKIYYEKIKHADAILKSKFPLDQWKKSQLQRMLRESRYAFL